MATDAKSYFTNAFPGENQTFPGNIFRLEANPVLPVGFRVARADGNVYRYAHFGAATTTGLICSQDLSEVANVDSDNAMVAPASANNTNDGTINSRFIEITNTGATADQFAGGYLITTDDTGEGYTYRIKGNTAAGVPATGNYRLELYEPLVVAIDATTDFAIIACLWNNLEAASTTDCALAGVSQRTTTAALPYAFVQTWGVCGITQDANVGATGDIATLSSLTSGNVGRFAADSVGTVAGQTVASDAIIGYYLDAGDATGQSTIYLQIAP